MLSSGCRSSGGAVAVAAHPPLTAIQRHQPFPLVVCRRPPLSRADLGHCNFIFVRHFSCCLLRRLDEAEGKGNSRPLVELSFSRRSRLATNHGRRLNETNAAGQCLERRRTPARGWRSSAVQCSAVWLYQRGRAAGCWRLQLTAAEVPSRSSPLAHVDHRYPLSRRLLCHCSPCGQQLCQLTTQPSPS